MDGWDEYSAQIAAKNPLEPEPAEPEKKPDPKKEEDDKPTWQEEEWESYEAYEDYYVRLVDDLYKQSREKWRTYKERWLDSERRLELDGLPQRQRPTRSELTLVPQAVEKAISIALDSLPRPTASSKQVTEEDFVAALNFFMGESMDQNNFDLLVARMMLDMKRFNLGVLKQTFDRNQKGPFNQDTKIVFTKTDPRYVWPDPFGKSWAWQDMAYLCVAEPMDLADIRSIWTDRGFLVEGESTYSTSADTDDSSGMVGGTMEISSPTMDNGFTIGERKRAMVKEMWLKDKQTVFKPTLNADGKTTVDEATGEPLGEWVPKYPNGRLIITANKVLLFDAPNPFRHGHTPYTFFENRLSTRLFSFGDVEILGRLEDKVNLIHKDMMKNARVNINAPYKISNNAFDSPEKYKTITNEENLIIVHNPGATVERLMPTEFPQFIFPLIQQLMSIFNDLSGVTDVMQGNVEKGSQLSADAISNLQGSSAATLKIKGRLLENALQEFGYQLAWNIRQAYIKDVTCDVTDPATGEKMQISWSADKDQPDISVGVEIGSSLPGAKQSAQTVAMQLRSIGAIDDEALLDAYNYPGRAKVLERKKDAVQAEILLARAGIDADLVNNDGAKPGSGAGRKKSDFSNL
ncbi:MAG TPA: hypothetical protein V6C86_24160 [Oculatellaceae cyanobacterium]